MILAIDHINIVVNDIDLMSQFYSDVIGLNVFKEARVSGDWLGSTPKIRPLSAAFSSPFSFRWAQGRRARYPYRRLIDRKGQ